MRNFQLMTTFFAVVDAQSAYSTVQYRRPNQCERGTLNNWGDNSWTTKIWSQQLILLQKRPKSSYEKYKMFSFVKLKFGWVVVTSWWRSGSHWIGRDEIYPMATLSSSGDHYKPLKLECSNRKKMFFRSWLSVFFEMLFYYWFRNVFIKINIFSSKFFVFNQLNDRVLFFYYRINFQFL